MSGYSTSPYEIGEDQVPCRHCSVNLESHGSPEGLCENCEHTHLLIGRTKYKSLGIVQSCWRCECVSFVQATSDDCPDGSGQSYESVYDR